MDEQTQQLLRDIWNQMKAMATKAELNALKADMNARFDKVDGELQALHTDMVLVKLAITSLIRDIADLKIDSSGIRIAYSALNGELVSVKKELETFRQYVDESLRAVRDALAAVGWPPGKPSQ